MSKGYSTVQVARMLGVDKATLLSLLEVSGAHRLDMATTSECTVVSV